MKQLVIISILALLLAGCDVRLPSGYATDVIDNIPKANEVLVDKLLKEKSMTDTDRVKELVDLINEDNKSFRAISATIKAGGGN